MLHIVKIGWNDSSVTRIQQVLAYALEGQTYTLYENESDFISSCRPRPAGLPYRAVLFAVALPPGGWSCSYVRLISWLATHSLCLQGWCGAVLIDGPGEWFTKKWDGN